MVSSPKISHTPQHNNQLLVINNLGTISSPKDYLKSRISHTTHQCNQLWVISNPNTISSPKDYHQSYELTPSLRVIINGCMQIATPNFKFIT